MESDSSSVKIFPDTPHLNSIMSKIKAFIFEPRSLKRNREVTLLCDQHTDDLLISIYNEVAAKLVTILTISNHFCYYILLHTSFCHGGQITFITLNDDRDIP